MSAKSYLKAAKQALQDENPDYCIQLALDCLNIDPKNYYAHIFIGKSSHLLNDITKAKSSYKEAIEIDPTSLIAWKGLLLIVKNDRDYKSFFEFAGDYAELLISLQEPLADFINDIHGYVQKYDSPEVHEEYLRVLLPENKLGQVTSGILEKPIKVIKQYLDIVLKRENTEVSKYVTRERMKSKNQTSGDAIAWGFYKDSQISHLYEELINVTNDDNERRIVEEKYLKYRVQVLKVAPYEIRTQLFEEIKTYIEGLIAVKHTSYFAWSLYFDWIDPESIFELDSSILKDFLKLFRAEPLGQIVHAFILSDFSPYRIELEESKNHKNKKEKMEKLEPSSVEEEELIELDTEKNNSDLDPEEILALMLQGLESCKTSLFAHRIVLSYHIYLKKFGDALPLCQSSVALLVTSTKASVISFPHTKRDFLVDYGTVLTYYQAPKNFPRAFEIFDKVLADFPENAKANVGKGLILAERGDLEAAKLLLEEVISKYPDNDEAIMELSWVQIKLNDHQTGREGLSEVLQNLKGNNLYVLELKASINWKIALSYIIENSKNVSKAYEYLVDSLRASSRYAPSYTSLGEIYLNHYEDTKRAQKCFIKAFELDSGEVKSAWYLVSDLTNKLDWEKADAFCTRVIASEDAKRRLGNDSWPYRILGCAALERQDDPDAVKWFQTAIRINSNDVESWIGLGEAYYGCGRLEAAAKVFKRSLELKPDHWIAQYLLGVIQSKTGEFEESIQILQNILNERPNEESVISALYEALLEYSNQSIIKGFFSKGIELALKTVDYLEQGNSNSFNFWKTLSDLIYIFLRIQSKIETFPYKRILALIGKTTLEVDNESILILETQNKIIEIAASLLIYSNQAVISLNPKSRPLRSVSFYNLGLAELFAYLNTKTIEYRDSAINNLKESIKLQNNYAESWIALGIASITVNSRVSQHCFIKASSIDPKNLVVWSNLALLYLRYDDPGLATEAYMRGQSLAPGKSISWLGHALASEAQGDFETASSLYTHAFILSNGTSPSEQLLYATDICLKRIGKGDDIRNLEAVQELSSASYGMLQYLKHYPTDPLGLSITALILERLNDYKLGKEISDKLLNLLEKAYEETEDELYLARFSSVKAQSARFDLGLGNYELAIEASNEALELSDDNRTIISARSVLGLSHFFLDNFDVALDEFKQILTISNDAKRLIVLISQVLYVYDTEETKQAALDQLFHNIEEYGSSLLVTLVIGAISIIENLDDYMEVVESELKSLPLSELLEDKFKDVPYLLSEISRRLSRDDANSHWQKSAFFFPNDLTVWNRLDENVSLKIAKKGKLSASDLSNAYTKSGSLEEIQRSLFLTPWDKDSVDALAGCF
ncbi:hypothetical protein WICMUC_004208 [Wickerhamomyces mucosus]|uniref:Superkiller protein 3 n=1 Tax=Wickerhamomyces mucosus TaxID=1378264 RepID=A0A9P8PHP1_9ASCO|nr:hypothetical protein WICMUC_004208 [Wickerhamomyces mucosus]